MAAQEPVFVVGAGGHARAILAVLFEPDNLDRYRVMAVVDHSGPRAEGETILGVEVIAASERWVEWTRPWRTCFLAIGANAQRRDAYGALVAQGFTLPNLFSRSAVVAPSARLGGGNFIGPLAHVGPLAQLGDNNIVNTQANLEHEVKAGSHNHFGPGSVALGRASVGDHCFLGARAVIRDGVSVADGTVVGACAFVDADVQDKGRTMVGLPARAIK